MYLKVTADDQLLVFRDECQQSEYYLSTQSKFRVLHTILVITRHTLEKSQVSVPDFSFSGYHPWEMDFMNDPTPSHAIAAKEKLQKVVLENFHCFLRLLCRSTGLPLRARDEPENYFYH